jgi:hypothetical protein
MAISTPQIRIISLPLSSPLLPPVTSDFIAIESETLGGRRVDVNTFLSQAGAALFVRNPATVTDRSIPTFDGFNNILRNNPNTSIDSAGGITATGFFSTSSERYKTNILPIPGCLELVKQLQGVSFNWIPDTTIMREENADIGLIAEHVNKVLPEVVRKTEEHCESIDYSKLVPILINAVKELATQVEELKRKINT